MFEARIQARVGTIDNTISTGTGKSVSKAITKACETMERTDAGVDRFVCRVFEDGKEIFWAFGDTAVEAVDEAKRMNNKSRRGGGR